MDENQDVLKNDGSLLQVLLLEIRLLLLLVLQC